MDNRSEPAGGIQCSVFGIQSIFSGLLILNSEPKTDLLFTPDRSAHPKSSTKVE
jgi:hypothetical protein